MVPAAGLGGAPLHWRLFLLRRVDGPVIEASRAVAAAKRPLEPGREALAALLEVQLSLANMTGAARQRRPLRGLQPLMALASQLRIAAWLLDITRLHEVVAFRRFV